MDQTPETTKRSRKPVLAGCLIRPSKKERMKTPAKAMQLELDWIAPVALKPTYPNRLGWMLAWLRDGFITGPHDPSIRPAIWGTVCGHVMVGVKGGTA